MNTEMQYELFNKHASQLVYILSETIEVACLNLNFDIRCLDWFSYTPDSYINRKNAH